MTDHRPDPTGLVWGARRIAVVGLSADPSRASHGVAQALRAAGHEVVPVNPTLDRWEDLPAYPDLASVPGRIDVVDVFRRPAHLPGVAREAVARDDVALVWNQLGLVSDEARQVVADAGRAYVEDACMKVVVAVEGSVAPRGPRLDAQVLLVDLDGTVLDYHAAEAQALARTLEGLGVPVDDATVAAYREVNADHWARFERGELTSAQLRVSRWVTFVDRLGLDADGEAASVEYLRLLALGGHDLPGARAALWWLARRATLVAVTNGFDDVQRDRIVHAGLADAFDAVLTSESMGVAKPDPQVVDLALAAVGRQDVDRADVAIVGDNLASDIAAGEAAGIRTVWVAPDDAAVPADGPQPDHVVGRLADIA